MPLTISLLYFFFSVYSFVEAVSAPSGPEAEEWCFCGGFWALLSVISAPL